MENEEIRRQIRTLTESAMLADEGVFPPEILARWQDRMRAAAAWCDDPMPDPPAFGVTVSPDALRADCTERAVCSGIENSELRAAARSDMADGIYIRVPKVVGE